MVMSTYYPTPGGGADVIGAGISAGIETISGMWDYVCDHPYTATCVLVIGGIGFLSWGMGFPIAAAVGGFAAGCAGFWGGC